jgi:pimeloyl-ACP methyl ester carboxylesterase
MEGKREMTGNIYAFSGLGADETVFEKLKFPGYAMTFIQWIQPLKNETMAAYASRLLVQITTPEPVLIGLSFGGMIAIEVARQIDTKQLILIASAKTKSEIPFYYRWAGKIGLHLLLPASLLKQPGFFPNWLFGVENKEEKEILNVILRKTDPIFLRWALHQLVCWTNEHIPEKFVQIHGTRDRLLPYRFVDCTHTIPQGGHFMTLNKSEELNMWLSAMLAK